MKIRVSFILLHRKYYRSNYLRSVNIAILSYRGTYKKQTITVHAQRGEWKPPFFVPVALRLNTNKRRCNSSSLYFTLIYHCANRFWKKTLRFFSTLLYLSAKFSEYEKRVFLRKKSWKKKRKKNWLLRCFLLENFYSFYYSYLF